MNKQQSLQTLTAHEDTILSTKHTAAPTERRCKNQSRGITDEK